MGTLIATIAYFWINRLLPVSLSQRISWEIIVFFTSFFIVFDLSIISTIYNKGYYAQIGLMAMLSALCIFLPALDIITSFPYLKAAITNHYDLYIIMDIVAFLFCLVFLRLYFYIQNNRGK